MRKLQPNDPQHLAARTVLRRIGPLLFIAGLLLTITAFISVVTSNGFPRYHWLAFVGMPLMFVGGAMSLFGFMGALARYQANEAAPVQRDSLNYTADQTRGGIKTIAGAIAEGVREGVGRVTRITCTRCGGSNDGDARFCKTCGTELKQ
jgi:hypothetical protein